MVADDRVGDLLCVLHSCHFILRACPGLHCSAVTWLADRMSIRPVKTDPIIPRVCLLGTQQVLIELEKKTSRTKTENCGK